MPPKVKFTREQIVDAAFEIAHTEGMEGITIRKIAAALGCSIAPIYVNFSHIDAVRQAVADRVVTVSRRILAETDTGNPFQDIGVASVRLARDYPIIFRDLVLSPNEYLPGQTETLDPDLLADLARDPDLACLSTDELQALLLKMRLFHTGIAAAMMNGILRRDTGEDEIINLMNETAGDLVAAARLRAAQPQAKTEETDSNGGSK